MTNPRWFLFRSSGISVLGQILAVAVAYAVAGRLGLLLAIPPGYATAIWPPSGIALAGVLLCGYRVWPGVLMGSFLVNVWTGFDASSLSSFMIPIGIGCGAALQAVISGFLVYRLAGFPNPLRTVSQIIGLLGFGGAIGCVVNATIGVGTLFIAGRVSSAEMPFSWMTWWAGDAIGVFVFTPVVLALLMQTRAKWKRRALPIVITTLTSFVFCIVLVAYTSDSGRRQVVDRLNDKGNELFESLSNAAQLRLNVVTALKAFLSHSEAPSPAEFRRYCATLKGDIPGIDVMEWIARVPSEQRRAFEAWARQQGLDGFTISDNTPQGIIPAPARPEHFPVTFIYPLGNNAKVTGFDMASRENRLQALRRARLTGKVAVTERIHLIQGGDAVLAIAPLTSLPVGADQGPDHGARDGFALVIFLLADIAQLQLPQESVAGIHYWVVDETVRLEPTILAASSSNPPAGFSYGGSMLFGADKSVEYTRPLDVGGRRWVLHVAPTQTFIAENLPQTAWYVLLGGMLMTGLMGALAMGITGREDELSEAVEKRTTALAQLKGRYQRLFDDSPDACLIMSLDRGKVTDCNRAAEVMLRGDRERIIGMTPDQLSPIMQPDGKTSTEAAAEKIVESLRQGGHRFEWMHHRFDGADFWAEVTISVMSMDDQQVLFVAWRDISDRKRTEAELERAEQALRISEERFQLAVRGSNDGLWDWNILNNTLYMAPRFKEIMGCRDDEVGTTLEEWSSRLHPDDSEATWTAVQAHLRNESPYEVEYRLLHKSGSYIWIKARGQAVFDQNGSPTRMAGSIRDITGQKDAELRLREALTFNETILLRSPLGIGVYHAGGYCVLVNDAYGRLVGASREQLRAQNLHEIKSFQVTGLYNDCLAARDDKQPRQREVHVTSSFGKEVWVTCHILPTILNREPHLVLQFADLTEIKRAEESLKESESRFRGAFDTAPHGMALVSTEGRWLKVNQTLCKIVGYDEPELLKTDFQTITHPDDLNVDLGYVQALLGGRIDTYQMEKRYFHKNGYIVWILLSVSLVRAADGRPLHFVSQIQDITEMKVAQERTARLAIVVRDSGDAIISEDLNGVITSWNPAAERLFGYRAEEMVGQSIDRLLPDGESEERMLLAALRQSKETFRSEAVRACKEGRLIDVALTISPIVDEVGKVIGAAKIITDITQRKRAEKALRESEARFRTLYESTPAMMHSIDPDGRIIYVSNNWLETLGYTRGEVIGRKSTDFLTVESCRFAVETVLPEFFRTGYCTDVPYQFLAKDGRILDTLLSAIVERDLNGRITNSFTVLQDVTQRNLDQRRIEQLVAEQKSILENELVGIVTVRNRVIIWTNPAYEKMLGYQPGELTGAPTRKNYTNEGAYRAFGDAAYPVLRSGKVFRSHMEQCRKDGSEVWLDVSGSLLNLETGEVCAYWPL